MAERSLGLGQEHILDNDVGKIPQPLPEQIDHPTYASLLYFAQLFMGKERVFSAAQAKYSSAAIKLHS